MVLGCRGVSRCEFRFDDRIEEAGLDCLEVSNQPGMIETSTVPDLARFLRATF